MVNYSIDQVVKRNGEFPTEADPNDWLVNVYLSFDALKRIRGDEGSQESFADLLSYPINLLRFTDNPGFYEIKRELPDGVHTLGLPMPFYAGNDEEATKMLEVEVRKWNDEHPNLFSVGELEDAVYDEDYPGKLTRMKEHPKMARAIDHQGYRRFMVG